MDTSIFKAYDIRGVYADQIHGDLVYKIAQSYAGFVKPKKVVLGRDVRVSGPELHAAAAQGLLDAGVDVVDIGVVSTDMMYFAAAKLGVDGGITISASHNPREYNGLKMVREQAIPISGDTGIYTIRDMVADGYTTTAESTGEMSTYDITNEYVDHCVSFIDIKKLRPITIVANANFGMAGKVLEKMIQRHSLPVTVVPLNFEPDGTFPKGRPDPFIPENREEMSKIIVEEKPDFGVAWDADADRVFFFDAEGNFIDGYFILAVLAQLLLDQNKNHGNVIIDARMVFASRKAIAEAGGVAYVNRIGHSLIKERMRELDAIFAGENSGHYYFKENYFCDNGMIPFLLIAEAFCQSGLSLADIVQPWTSAVSVSGEHNFKVTNTDEVIAVIRNQYTDGKLDETDGVSIEYEDARFNVRASNTEPLLRLNVEAYSQKRMQQLFDDVVAAIKPYMTT